MKMQKVPFSGIRRNLEQIPVRKEGKIKEISYHTPSRVIKKKKKLRAMDTQTKVNQTDTPGNKIIVSKWCQWVRG